jgi:hypothetical protein
MSRTYEEQFEEALQCNTIEEASTWINKELEMYQDEYGQSSDIAIKTILSNLGYMAGYYSEEIQLKIFHLFGASHPIFGKPPYNTTSEEAFKMGEEFVKNGKPERK